MGPYDQAIQTLMKRDRDLRNTTARRVLTVDPPEPGLVAWWSFDEDADCPVASDGAGNRLGGILRDAARADGRRGKALVCAGGCVTVPENSRLFPTNSLTVECWVKSDVAGQTDKWFVNGVFGGGFTGYRMGLVGGKPCFQVPLTAWSHSLSAASALPLGQWTHLAGTFDGCTLRIYVDGVESGKLERPGPMKPNTAPLCLGNFAEKHAAHFTGLLDEVKVYDRALTPAEVSVQARIQ